MNGTSTSSGNAIGRSSKSPTAGFVAVNVRGPSTNGTSSRGEESNSGTEGNLPAKASATLHADLMRRFTTLKETKSASTSSTPVYSSSSIIPTNSTYKTSSGGVLADLTADHAMASLHSASSGPLSFTSKPTMTPKNLTPSHSHSHSHSKSHKHSMSTASNSKKSSPAIIMARHANSSHGHSHGHGHSHSPSVNAHTPPHAAFTSEGQDQDPDQDQQQRQTTDHSKQEWHELSSGWTKAPRSIHHVTAVDDYELNA